MSSPNGDVTEEEWLRFCEEQVTAVFPVGYTALAATGYWRSGERATAREETRVILVVAPAEAKAKVLSVAERYRRQFNQEAVLVVTSSGEVDFVDEGR